MPRPKRNRKMHHPPWMHGFKPFGTPLKEADSVTLLFEEFEAIKLTDYHDLTQAEAAKRMNVSRPTFTRIYENARKTIALALTQGKAIFIEGGFVEFDEEWFKCDDCYSVFSVKKGQEASGCIKCDSPSLKNISDYLKLSQKKEQVTKHEMGKGGNCICVNCEILLPHQQGVPCRTVICPKCGQPMLRENSPQHKLLQKKK
jgi:uncharacterized protein